MEVLPSETLSLIVEYVGVDCALHMTTPALRAMVMRFVRNYEFREHGLIPLPAVKNLTIHDHFDSRLPEFYPSLVSLRITRECEFKGCLKLPQTLTKFSYNQRANENLLSMLRKLPLIEWDLFVMNDSILHLIPTGEFVRAKLEFARANDEIPYGVTEVIVRGTSLQTLGYLPESVTVVESQFAGRLLPALPPSVTELRGPMISVRSDEVVRLLNKLKRVESLQISYQLAKQLTVKVEQMYVSNSITYQEFLTLPDIEHLSFNPAAYNIGEVNPNAHPNLKSIAICKNPWKSTAWVPKSVLQIYGEITKTYLKDLDVEFRKINIHPHSQFMGNLYISGRDSNGKRFINPKTLPAGSKISELYTVFDGKLGIVIPPDATIDYLHIEGSSIITGRKVTLSMFLPLIKIAKQICFSNINLFVDVIPPDCLDYIWIEGYYIDRRVCTSRELARFWKNMMDVLN